MTVDSPPWTAVRDTPNKSPRLNVPRLGCVLHHAATTDFAWLQSVEVNGTKQVSSTAICLNEILEKIIPDGFRAWSLSDAWWDSALHSVETCNESTNGWTVSDASHWSLARAVAYWAHTEGWWPHRDGDPKTWTVIGHREVYTIHGGSYATACPGGMDLALVTARAQQLLTVLAASLALTQIGSLEMKPYVLRDSTTGQIGVFAGGDLLLFDNQTLFTEHTKIRAFIGDPLPGYGDKKEPWVNVPSSQFAGEIAIRRAGLARLAATA